MYKSIFISILFLTNLQLLAQKQDKCNCYIKGVVKDNDSGQPLVGVIIQIKENKIFAVTDTLGRYYIDNLCQGKYTISSKILGYKEVFQSISLVHEHQNDNNIELHEDEIHLKDVEIRAVRIEAPITQNVKTLNYQNLTNTRGQNLGEILNQVVGITTFQTGSTISKPVIHGLHSNRILILNNGLRQEGQQWGAEHAPEIDPFVANQISVIKGPASVRYGADAIGGVILIEPAALPTNKTLGGEMNLVGMSNGKVGNASLMLEGSTNFGLSWRVQGSLKQAGNFKTAQYYLANTGTNEQNYSAELGYRKNKKDISVYYSQFKTQIGVFSSSHIGNLTDLQNAIALGEPLIKSDFSYQIASPYQNIVHQLLKIKSGIQIGKNHLNILFGRQYDNRAEFDIHGQQSIEIPALLFRLTTFTGDLVFDHAPILKSLAGKIGISSLYQYNFMDGRPLIPDFEQYNFGLFAIEKWIKPKYEIEFGARIDKRNMSVYQFVNRQLNTQYHQFQNAVGSLGIVYHFNKKVDLKLNVGTAWRPPNVSELYSNGVHHGAATYEEGDVNLKAEASTNLTTSLNYTSKFTNIELDLYHHYIQNYIYLKPQNQPILTVRGAFPYFKYTQTNATFMGLDLMAVNTISKAVGHTLKLSYLQVYDVLNQDYIVQIPANRIENMLSLTFLKNKKPTNTHLTLSHLWVAEQKRVPLNSDFAPPPPAYHLWNLEFRSEYAINKEHKLKWGLSVQNLLNTSYKDYMNRFRYFAHEIGRNITLRLNYQF